MSKRAKQLRKALERKKQAPELVKPIDKVQAIADKVKKRHQSTSVALRGFSAEDEINHVGQTTADTLDALTAIANAFSDYHARRVQPPPEEQHYQSRNRYMEGFRTQYEQQVQPTPQRREQPLPPAREPNYRARINAVSAVRELSEQEVYDAGLPFLRFAARQLNVTVPTGPSIDLEDLRRNICDVLALPYRPFDTRVAQRRGADQEPIYRYRPLRGLHSGRWSASQEMEEVQYNRADVENLLAQQLREAYLTHYPSVGEWARGADFGDDTGNEVIEPEPEPTPALPVPERRGKRGIILRVKSIQKKSK